MRVTEFGQENHLTIMLLHGGGLGWWNYKQVSEILAQKYHVVIPALNGHANSDNDFNSIEDTAKEIIEYINTHLDGKVYAIGGLSLGGQILVEMLCTLKDICQYALIESALIKPMEITNLLVRPMIKMSYSLVKKPWFAKLQFKQLRIRQDLYNDYYNDTCKITMDNMIAFLESNSSYKPKESLCLTTAKVLIVAGEKESKKMKESAKLLNKIIPQSKLTLLAGYYHGELSINHSEEYANLFTSLMEQ